MKYKKITVGILLGLALFAGTLFWTKTPITKAESSDLNFVVLPDLQNENSDVIDSTCQWILDSQLSQNIQAVVTVGDLTNFNSDTEYQRLLPCFTRLTNAGLILLPIVGNHDYGSFVPRSTSKFDQYFGPTYFAGKSWYGGNYAGSDANYYVKFTVGSRKFMIMALEFFPRPEVVNWAAGVLDSNQDYETVITTHAYLNADGTRTLDSDPYGPNDYGLPTTDNNGEDLWNNLVKKKPNIKMVVNGHFLAGNTARRSDAGDYGNVVHQLFNNWQESTNGGDGWLGLVKLSSANSTANVSYIKTYNPPFTLSWPTGTILPVPINQAPVVNAGPDQTLQVSTSTVTGIVTDDGLPTTTPLTIVWSKISGPGSVDFSSPNATSTNITFGADGTYILRLTASDGSLSSTDDTTIYVNPQNISSWYDANLQYRKNITIPQGRVSADLTNFPVLVSFTDPDLKSVANGGQVMQAQGYDIVFTDLLDQKLNYEIEKYNPATGELTAWVKVPTLSSNSDTSLHMYFGNSAATNQQNKTGVWDSNFMGVWHLSEKSGNQLDSTSKSNNSTSVVVQAEGQDNGKIAGDDLFNLATHVVSIPANAPSLKKQFSKMSISAWVKPTAFSTGSYGPTIISNTDSDGWAMRVNNGFLTSDIRLSTGNVQKQFGTKLTLNAWSYISLVYDGSKIWGYINGQAVASFVATGFVKNTGNSSSCTSIGNEVVGCSLQGAEFPFKGDIDEVRVSDDARTPAWVAAEYSNLSDPASFMNVSGIVLKP